MMKALTHNALLWGGGGVTLATDWYIKIKTGGGGAFKLIESHVPGSLKPLHHLVVSVSLWGGGQGHLQLQSECDWTPGVQRRRSFYMATGSI